MAHSPNAVPVGAERYEGPAAAAMLAEAMVGLPDKILDLKTMFQPQAPASAASGVTSALKLGGPVVEFARNGLKVVHSAPANSGSGLQSGPS